MKHTIEFQGNIIELDDQVPELQYLPMLRNQLVQLEKWRDDGRVPSQRLLEDIAVYKAILDHENPVDIADKYMKARHKVDLEEYTLMHKSDIADEIGLDWRAYL